MKKLKKSVVLIGFMGCGKSTIGRGLARALEMSVEDTDTMIEERAGKSVSAIFAEDGEPVFRNMETELLEDLKGSETLRILSVGGGMPVKQVNRGLLKECGTVIYLRIRPETVYDRLKGDTTRPLLQCEEPLERINTLMSARKEAYEESADIIFDVDGLSVDEIVEQLLDAVCEAE